MVELSYEQKLLIARLKAECTPANQVWKKVGISKDRYYRALKEDEELRMLCEDLATTVDKEKARALLNVKERISRYFNDESEKLINLFSSIIDVPKTVIDASSLRDRMGAGKLLLEMMERQVSDGEENNGIDETPAIIEVVVEDASGGE